MAITTEDKPTVPPSNQPRVSAVTSITFLAIPIFNPLLSRPTITPSLGPEPMSAPTYIAVPEPIQSIPIKTNIHLRTKVSALRSKLITRSATVPIQKISTRVAIQGFCFNGIHRSVTKMPVAMIAFPKVRLVLREMPS